MADSTGPVLAVGAITMANASILNGKPVNFRVPVGTAIAAGLFALGERAWPGLVKALAWMALGTVILSRVQPDVPAPAESLLAWWQGGAGTPVAPASSSKIIAV